VRSYIPGSVTDQTRFGEKIDHGCAGNATMLRCITSVALEPLRCVTVHSATSRYTTVLPQSLCITTEGQRSRTTKPRCFTVVFKYQWFFFCETFNRNVLCQVQNSIYIVKQKEQQCEWKRRFIA